MQMSRISTNEKLKMFSEDRRLYHIDGILPCSNGNYKIG